MGKSSEKSTIWVGLKPKKGVESSFDVVAGSTLKKLSDESGVSLRILKNGESKYGGEPFWAFAGEDLKPDDCWYVCRVGLAKIEGRGGLRTAGGNSGFDGFLGMKGSDGLLK